MFQLILCSFIREQNLLLVMTEDRCQTIATLARHLGTSGNMIVMNLICTTLNVFFSSMIFKVICKGVSKGVSGGSADRGSVFCQSPLIMACLQAFDPVKQHMCGGFLTILFVKCLQNQS